MSQIPAEFTAAEPTRTADDHAPPDAARPYRWRWATLFAVLAAEVMDLLDALVTTIAGPSIRLNLGGTESLIQWLGTGYTLAMAIGLVTGGRLGDLYGRRRMFLVGLVGFVTGSVLCGLAQSPEMLIGARVLQGLFGSVLLPQGLGLLKEAFPPNEQATAFGAFGPVMGLSAVGGPILAGWLVTADLLGTGWRAIFLINLPIGLLALVGALCFLPRTLGTHARSIDVTGMGLVSLASFLLVYPLVQGRELGWPAWTFASIGTSAVLFGIFGYQQARTYRGGGDPLVMPTLFTRRAFTGGLVAGLAFFSALIGFSLVFSLYLQIGLHYSPLKTGLAGIPQAAGMVVAFVAGGAAGLPAKLGRRLIHLGMVVVFAGVSGVLATVELVGAQQVSPWQLAPSLAVTGAGMGMAMMPFFDIVLAGVDEREIGSASGTLNAVQQFGGALGIAVLGTVFFSTLDAGRGFGPAVRTALWMELALLVGAFLVAFTLPRQARPGAAGH